MIVVEEKCFVCGNIGKFEISEDATLFREARCSTCGASIRNSDISKYLLKELNCEDFLLNNISDKINAIKILNTCSSGYIHEKLKACPGYVASEYFDGIDSGAYQNGVLCVNLCNIPFDDNYFDIVISEDVFEHIRDYKSAFDEVRRVLKKGGKHLFTIPLHEGRKTISRIGNPNKIYHGDPIRSQEGCIVYTDFGSDIMEHLNKIGLETECFMAHKFYEPDEITEADATYDDFLKKFRSMETYFKYNSIVFVSEKKENDTANIKEVNGIFTGERFIPGIEDKKLEIEHFQRYMGICDFVAGKTILDAACGEGYGSRMLAEYADKVVGIDISEDAVSNAMQKYSEQKNLSFKVGSIASLPLENQSIDVVISYETIEHVDAEIQEQFLLEIKRVLKPEGVLIMSTPNKELYTDLYDYHNEFHMKEFYKEEFKVFLKSSFLNVKLYNQFFEVTSVIDSCDGEVRQVKYYKDTNCYTQDGKYYIAVASNGEIPEINISSVYMNSSREYEENIHRIIQLQKEEESRNRHIQLLDSEIGEKGKTIKELQEEVRERNGHIQKLDSEHQKNQIELQQKDVEQQKKDVEIKLKEVELQKKDVEIQLRDVQLQDKVLQYDKLKYNGEKIIENHIKQVEELESNLNCLKRHIDEQIVVIQNGEEKIRGLELELKESAAYIYESEESSKALRQTICNKEGHIELLLETERIFEREKATHSYKMAKRIQKIGDVLLPPDSRRRFFLRILFNLFRHPGLMIHVINPVRIKNYIKYMRKEGMAGVKSRYEEAIAKERSYRNPAGNLELRLEKIPVQMEYINMQFNMEVFECIEFTEFKNPLVSIIVPVYNEFGYTYNCLKTIQKNSGNITYEIVIANDCSTDETMHMQEIIKNIRVITTENNSGFILNCNHAAQYARGKYILFLNNDTQVQDNWLEPLVTLIESDKTIGMVGSKLVYEDGRLQEAGGIVWRDASAWNYGHLLNPENPEFNYVKEADYISGAAIMIRSHLWNEIGGFDERYAPAYYEDTDLAFEVRKHGYKVMYQPLSLVVHFEGISNGTDINGGLKQYQTVNFEKFHEKWKGVLETEQEENGVNVFKAKDRSLRKKHILVVDHYVPHHDKDAGGKCTYMYLKLFVHMGLKVTFIGDNYFKHEPYTTELNQMGIEVLYGNYYYNNWEGWLKENGYYFDYIYLQRPHIAVRYIDLVKNYSKAKIFYFAHDLHHVRERREYELSHDPEKLKSAERWKEIEYELFRKADVGHVVGSYEQNIMKGTFPDKPIRNIPLYIYEELIGDINKDFSSRNDLIYVGGFGHPPNIDAVLWFAENVFPNILKKYPTMKWYVIGGKVPKEIAALADEHILVKGFVPDEELDILYRKCRLAVVPLRIGAGVKGKVVEAAYYQIPLITTNIGAEGLSEEEGNFIVKDDAGEMADAICKLYEDYSKLLYMSDAGRQFIQNYFMLQVAENVIRLDM